MLCLGRLCGLMPASGVVTDNTSIVPGLLAGLEHEEGASLVSVNCCCVVIGHFVATSSKRCYNQVSKFDLLEFFQSARASVPGHQIS